MCMTNRLHCIYVLKDENGNIFYVGKTATPNKRFRRHLTHVRVGSNYPVHNKLRKVILLKGNSDGVYNIIESEISQTDIDNREMFFIRHYKDSGCRLKNLTDGGEGGKGMTEETRKKLSLIRLGKKLPPETCKKISESKLGIPFTDQHKRSLKKAWKTRPPMPLDWGERLSKLNRGKINIKKFTLLSPTGELITTKNGLTDFCREHGLSPGNLHKTLNGERDNHKGWKLISRA